MSVSAIDRELVPESSYTHTHTLAHTLVIAVHVVNKVIYQLTPQTLQVTQTILSPSVLETVSIRENKSQKYRHFTNKLHI